MSERTTTQGVDELSCDQIAAHAFAERYLLGELSEPERDAYERHYFDCERCFHELTTVGAVRIIQSLQHNPQTVAKGITSMK